MFFFQDAEDTGASGTAKKGRRRIAPVRKKKQAKKQPTNPSFLGPAAFGAVFRDPLHDKERRFDGVYNPGGSAGRAYFGPNFPDSAARAPRVTRRISKPTSRLKVQQVPRTKPIARPREFFSLISALFHFLPPHRLHQFLRLNPSNSYII